MDNLPSDANEHQSKTDSVPESEWPPVAIGRLLRFLWLVRLLIATRLVLVAVLKLKNRPLSPPIGPAPQPATPVPTTPILPGEAACCKAVVLVGDVTGAWPTAWKNVGREIASDLQAKRFRTTLITNATTADVMNALADRSLKILVIIGHGEAHQGTATIYMNGDENSTSAYLTAALVEGQLGQHWYRGKHPCLKKVILESCFSGSKTKRPLWEKAFGLTGDDLVAPSGETNGITTYWYYFFKTDYSVFPDPNCFEGIAPVPRY